MQDRLTDAGTLPLHGCSRRSSGRSRHTSGVEGPEHSVDDEHQLIKLRTELAAARQASAAEFVIRGYEDEIHSFEVVTEAMRIALARLPDQERLEVEEASAPCAPHG